MFLVSQFESGHQTTSTPRDRGLGLRGGEKFLAVDKLQSIHRHEPIDHRQTRQSNEVFGRLRREHINVTKIDQFQCKVEQSGTLLLAALQSFPSAFF